MHIKEDKNTHGKTENRGSIKMENNRDKTELRLMYQLYQQM